MGQDNPYAVFRYAVDHEAALRARGGATERALPAVGFPQTGDVELSDPSRLGPGWRAGFATGLIIVSLVVVLTRFFTVKWTRTPQPSDEVFYVVLISLLVCFLLMVVSWGSVKVKWSPAAEADGEDSASAGDPMVPKPPAAT